MGDQVTVDNIPLVVSSNPGSGTPETAAVHPPTQSYGPGSADETAGSGPTPVDPADLPGNLGAFGGTGDRGGGDVMADRGPQRGT